MPVVVAMAESFGLSGYETHEELAADAARLERIDGFRTQAAELMGLGDVSTPSIPKTVLLATARDGGQVCTRSFIPVQPHTSLGVPAAVSTVRVELPGRRGARAGVPEHDRADPGQPHGELRNISDFVAPPMLEGTVVDTTTAGQPAVLTVQVQKYNGRGYDNAETFG